jgi:translation initiation factor 3 subunit D
MWCGELASYDKVFDRLTVRTEQPMRRFEDLNFFNVTTSDDPILTDFCQSDPDVTVIATDHVLACLVAAARSVYSWDLVISKVSNKIIIDKRDFSQVDFLSVNETAQEPPSNDDKENLNSAVKLSQEASCINQNFSQMVLDANIEVEEMENPNPFEEEGDSRASSGAYRYRKFTIPGNAKDSNEFNQNPVSIIVRTEVNCKMPGGDDQGDRAKQQLCSLKALNEYDPKVNYSWKKHLESQRGMILATELKNNSYKLGRWTAQAILAGCNIMKIGYASRIDAKDPWSHSILSVQTHITDKFAEQIGMHRNNVFGIIRSIVDMVMSWEDGKYLLIKDPLKGFMRIFEVPWETFADDDDGEGEEEEEDEGEDLDEDGNIKPPQPGGPMAQ